MEPLLSRRTFLLGAATLAGAAACSKATGVPKAADQLNLLLTSGAPDGPGNQGQAVFLAGIDQRVGFVLRGLSDFISPAPGTVTVAFSTDAKRSHWDPAGAPDVHADAGTAPTYLTATHRFPRSGTAWVRATYEGRSADAPFSVIDPSAARIPTVGKPMISTATPIVGDNQGVNPICTRKPPCPFHGLSLAAALTQHLPIALLFATPALCQTATCGPVLDTLIGVSAPFAGKVSFIHSEIYTDSTAKTTAPAVDTYHLQSEPVLFLADAIGVVTDRIDGLYGKGEAAAGLSRLVGT